MWYYTFWDLLKSQSHKIITFLNCRKKILGLMRKVFILGVPDFKKRNMVLWNWRKLTTNLWEMDFWCAKLFWSGVYWCKEVNFELYYRNSLGSLGPMGFMKGFLGCLEDPWVAVFCLNISFQMTSELKSVKRRAWFCHTSKGQ